MTRQNHRPLNVIPFLCLLTSAVTFEPFSFQTDDLLFFKTSEIVFLFLEEEEEEVWSCVLVSFLFFFFFADVLLYLWERMLEFTGWCYFLESFFLNSYLSFYSFRFIRSIMKYPCINEVLWREYSFSFLNTPFSFYFLLKSKKKEVVYIYFFLIF